MIALAPGFGPGWLRLDPDAVPPTADITLTPERVVHGRLYDVQGKPVPNVKLSVASIRRAGPAEPLRVRGRFDGVAYSSDQVVDVPAWPRPVTTDTEGRYKVRGMGPEIVAVLTVHDPRFALQRIPVQANDASETRPMTAALIPAQTLSGRVTYADTGKGVPHAPLAVRSSTGRNTLLGSSFETDAEGRFRVNPPLADRLYGITAFPPKGQPYLIARKVVEWPKGAIEQSVDIALLRGILVRGKVTENGSGEPIAGVTVFFDGRGKTRSDAWMGASSSIPRPMARFSSASSRPRDTWSSGHPTMITFFRKSAFG